MPNYGKVALSMIEEIEKNKTSKYKLSNGVIRGSIIAPSSVFQGNTAPFSITDQLGATYIETVVVAQDATDLSVVFSNIISGGNGANNISVRAGFRHNNSFYPWFFNGKRNVNIEPGGHAVSDALSVLVKKGDVIEVHTLVTVDKAGETWPGSYYTTSHFPGVTDYTLSAPPSLTPIKAFGPTTIIGVTSNPLPNVLLLGGSSIVGKNDSIGSRGFARMAVEELSGWLKVAEVGGTLSAFVSAGGYSRRSLLSGYDIAICDHGSNDIATGKTFEEIKTDLQKLWDMLHLSGVKVFQCTMKTRTTSTDSWVTVENQTSVANYGPNSIRTRLNDWIRTNPYPLSGHLETADVGETARNSGLRKPGTTNDGIHDSPDGVIIAAAEIRRDFNAILNASPDNPYTPPSNILTGVEVVDSFNRPDSQKLGFADSGHLWATLMGTEWGIETGKAYNLSPSNSSVVVVSTGLSKNITVSAEATPSTTPKKSGIVFLGRDSSNFFFLTSDTANNGQMLLRKREGGTYTTIQTIPTSLASGVKVNIKVTIVGKVITCYIDDTVIGTYTLTDSEYATFGVGTLHGLYCHDGSTTLWRWSNFKVTKI